MVEQRPFKALVVGSSPTQPTACFLGRFYPLNQLPERLCRQSRFRKSEAKKVSSEKAENGETDRKTSKKYNKVQLPFRHGSPLAQTHGMEEMHVFGIIRQSKRYAPGLLLETWQRFESEGAGDERHVTVQKLAENF
jgi:hypothetical protein